MKKRNILPRLGRCWRAQCPGAVHQPCWLTGAKARMPGMNLRGFMLSEVGLGEAARLLVAAADTQDFPVTIVNRPLEGRENVRDLADRVSAPRAHRASVVVAGLRDLRGLRHEVCRLHTNIAFVAWELETLPDAMQRYFPAFDAYWVPSTFVRDAMAVGQSKPVHLVKQPLELPDEDPAPAFTGSRLTVLTFFDYDSFVTRKNPEAAVRAFQAAFPAARDDVALVVKTRGAVDRGRREWLADAAAKDPRIRVIDHTLTRDEMRALMRDSDVFLSLHRSEGFGFGCAEALAAGRAVVSTDYGGCTDFITGDTGFPVEWTRRALVKGDYIGWEGASWAEPSIEHAATLLRDIYDAPDTATLRTRAGLRLLREEYSLEAAGRTMRHLLRNEGAL